MLYHTNNTKKLPEPEPGTPTAKNLFASPMEDTYNRKYKDTLFTSLFKDKRYAKLLYEALFPDREPIAEDDIEILNLENIFTVDCYNDACMLFKDILVVLTEHQSTTNLICLPACCCTLPKNTSAFFLAAGINPCLKASL